MNNIIKRRKGNYETGVVSSYVNNVSAYIDLWDIYALTRKDIADMRWIYRKVKKISPNGEVRGMAHTGAPGYKVFGIKPKGTYK